MNIINHDLKEFYYLSTTIPAMRGLRNSAFGRAMVGLKDAGINAVVGVMRKSLGSGIQKDFLNLAKQFTKIEVDLEKMLIRCDDGDWKTPQDWDKDVNMGALKINILMMGMEMYKEMGRKLVTLNLPKDGSNEVTIQFDNGKKYKFSEEFEARAKDPVDRKAILLAKTIEKTDYAKDIVIQK